MVAILRYHVPTSDSDLGRALHELDGATVELEPLVPGGRASVPFFWIRADDPDRVVASLRERPSVETVEVVETIDDATLIALEWNVDDDAVFRTIADCDGHILQAACREDRWEFTVRFFEHEDLSALKRGYEARDVGFTVDRVYHHSDPSADSEFGLTESQREALALAVERGYYAIPRKCTTAELADELGISAQAVTERLRRAVANLTRSTLLASGAAE